MTAQRMQGNRAADPYSYHYNGHDRDKWCGGEYPCVPVEVSVEEKEFLCTKCGGAVAATPGLKNPSKGHTITNIRHFDPGDCIRHLAAQIAELRRRVVLSDEAAEEFAALRERVEALERVEFNCPRYGWVQKCECHFGIQSDAPPPPKASGERWCVHPFGLGHLEKVECPDPSTSDGVKTFTPPAPPTASEERCSSAFGQYQCVKKIGHAHHHRHSPYLWDDRMNDGTCEPDCKHLTPPAPEANLEHDELCQTNYVGKCNCETIRHRPAPSRNESNDGRSAGAGGSEATPPVAGSTPASSLTPPAADAGEEFPVRWASQANGPCFWSDPAPEQSAPREWFRQIEAAARCPEPYRIEGLDRTNEKGTPILFWHEELQRQIEQRETTVHASAECEKEIAKLHKLWRGWREQYEQANAAAALDRKLVERVRELKSQTYIPENGCRVVDWFRVEDALAGEEEP